MKITTEKLFNGVGFLNLIIIVSLCIILPNEYNEKYQCLVELIKKYPLHTKGLYSENRPFLSFVLTNYVAIFSPIIALMLFIISIIFNIPSKLTTDLQYVTFGIGICVAIFFIYAININVSGGDNAPRGDSLATYITYLYSCSIFISISFPMLMLRLR